MVRPWPIRYPALRFLLCLLAVLNGKLTFLQSFLKFDSVVDHLVLLRHEVGVERVAAVGLTEHHFLRVNKDRAGERVLIFLARRQLRRLTGQRL